MSEGPSTALSKEAVPDLPSDLKVVEQEPDELNPSLQGIDQDANVGHDLIAENAAAEQVNCQLELENIYFL